MIKWRVSSGYARVNRRRPCRVCGKPDWCSYTRDEEVSICMRVREGARRINRHGGAIFIHDGPEAFIVPHPSAEIRQVPLAPKHVRDFVYQELILLSPALLFRRFLIDGPKGLKARGLRSEHWRNYGSLPARCAERDRLAHTLLNRVSKRFPNYGSLRGVPGFWCDEDGWHLWTRTNYCRPRLLIPCRDSEGLLQACQMRTVSDDNRKKARYYWLSSSGMPNGVGSGSPLHFIFQERNLLPDDEVYIVEGLLKADALVAMQPHMFSIAVGGVSAGRESVLEATHARRVVVAFDQDYLTNLSVCRMLTDLLARRIEREGNSRTTRVAVWSPAAKGIDEAAVEGLPIQSLCISSWWQQLPLELRQKISFAPNFDRQSS